MPVLELQAKDLTKEPARSGNEPLGGYLGVGRALDKCRATLAGTQDGYHFNCPLDAKFFTVAGIDAEEFKNFVATGATDEEVAAWVDSHAKSHTAQELEKWNETLRNYGPDSDEKWTFFKELRNEVAPDREDIKTWYGVLDAEEGRAV